MTAGISPLTQRAAWKDLAAHYAAHKDVPLRQLFADDPARGQRLTLGAVGIYFDYSKNRATDETLRLLVQLAEESGVARRRDAMFAATTNCQATSSPLKRKVRQGKQRRKDGRLPRDIASNPLRLGNLCPFAFPQRSRRTSFLRGFVFPLIPRSANFETPSSRRPPCPIL